MEPTPSPPAGRHAAALAVPSATPSAVPQPSVLLGESAWLLGARFASLRELLEAWPTDGVGLEEALGLDAVKAVPLADLRLCAPVDAAAAVLGIGKNYSDHVKEVASSLPHVSSGATPTSPIVFQKATSSTVAHGDAIRLPPHAAQVDYEGEVGVVIGRLCRRVAAADALAHVFGVLPLNDVSARDLQARHQQWFLAKSADTFCPVGPFILPLRAEGLAPLDAASLGLRTWVNGELRQSGNTAQLLFGLPQLIECISAVITLRPGDVIATGTPAGVGAGFSPPRWLAAGDVVRVEIDDNGARLCVLENEVRNS